MHFLPFVYAGYSLVIICGVRSQSYNIIFPDTLIGYQFSWKPSS